MRFTKVRALATALMVAWTGTALAEGVFVPAPSRVDHVYDDARGVLYISNGDHLLRYELATGTFLEPLTIGTALTGLDLAPDAGQLVAADTTLAGVRIVDLDTLEVENAGFTRSFSEGGTWSVAYGADGSILMTSTFNGSGWVPMRRYVPSTSTMTVIASSVRQDTMLAPSGDRTMAGFAESNSSSGPFGRYRISDGDIIRKEGYTDGTSWFNYEIACSRDGEQCAIPTYGGTFLTDAAMVKLPQVIGVYAGAQPIGAAYHPELNRVYFPFATTTQVRVYDTGTLAQIDAYEFEHSFQHPGNWAYQSGRAKVSRDGKWLFVNVAGGVRYVSLFARAPVQLMASAGDGSVTLEWDAAPDATGYSVYQGTSANGEGAAPVLTGVAGTSVTIDGLANGTTYYFRVATETADGTSTPSTEASALPVPPPAAVTDLTASARDGGVQLSWASLQYATSYIIYQGTTPGDLAEVATGVTGTFHTVDGLANGTTYYFRVAGANNSGTGTPSSEVSATPLPPPAAPTDLSAVPGDREVTLQWTAADTATSYNVYISLSPDYPSVTPSRSNIAGTSITIDGLGNGTTYYFAVAAVNSAGVGAKSGEASATPTPMTHVALWLSQSTVAAGQSATLNWLASNATACTASGAWNGSPSFSGRQDLVLAAGSYTFTLGCDGPNGSDEESATLTVTPAAPGVTIGLDTTAIETGGGATLSWSAVNADTCTASDAWSGSRALSGSAYVQPAAAGSYTYSLTCGNGDGDNTQSVTLSVSDPAGPTLTMSISPGTLTLGSAATLSWSSTDADECTATDAWSGTKPTASSIAVQPIAVGGYTYSLTCSGPGGTTARSVALIVNPIPVVADSGGSGGSGSLDPRALLALTLLGLRRRRLPLSRADHHGG